MAAAGLPHLFFGETVKSIWQGSDRFDRSSRHVVLRGIQAQSIAPRACLHPVADPQTKVCDAQLAGVVSDIVLQSWDASFQSVRANSRHSEQMSPVTMLAESLQERWKSFQDQTGENIDDRCDKDPLEAAILSTLVVTADGDQELYLSLYNQLLRLGRLGSCVSLLEDMKKVGILDVNKIFQKRFFKECQKQKAVTAAFQFTSLLPGPSLAGFTQLIAVCASAGHAEGAQRAFRAAQSAGIQPDCTLYTSLISAYSKAGQLDLAFKVFHEMESAGVEPSVHTYSALIDGCARAKQTAKAFGVYGISMAKKLKPDRMLFHSLITACASTEGLDRAFDVLQDMRAQKIEPDHYTMTLLLDACTSCGKIDRAMGVYRTLRDKGAATTAATFTAAINACAVGGSYEQALRIYGHMKKDGIKPDETVFCALIKVATRAKQVDAAFSFLNEMRNKRVIGTTKIYNSLFNLCCELELPERCLELYSTMKTQGQKPTVVTFNALMQTLCNSQLVDRALLLLDEMVQEGVTLNHRTYNILLKGCADSVAFGYQRSSFWLHKTAAIIGTILDYLKRRAKKVDVAFKLYHAADLDGKAFNLANCSSMLEICYDQIRAQAPPPSFSFTVGRFPADAAIGSPQQQWAACALAIYRQNVTAGVIPTRPLLSKALGCLRVRNDYDVGLSQPSFAYGGDFGRRLGGGRSEDSCGLDSIYEARAAPLYDEAAALGVVPDVSGAPTLIDVDGLPTNAAEVCILSFLKQTLRLLRAEGKRSLASSFKCSSLTIKVPTNEMVTILNENQGERKVRIASRPAQAIAALLRRLGVPFTGYESSGKLQIQGSALQKWLRQQNNKRERPSAPQPGLPATYRQQDAAVPIVKLGRTIIQQQMAIRMSSVPEYSPANFYRRPSFIAPNDSHATNSVHEKESVNANQSV